MAGIPLLSEGVSVRHPGFGLGTVEMATKTHAAVRFDADLKMVELAQLTVIRDVASTLVSGKLDDADAVIAKVQALAIRSINDEWGIFSRSRIALLPHQLWVCRKVTETWPFHWLVADDVGLGKTIECGLILSALTGDDAVRRVLILCPAGLTEQWRHRLKSMFDQRFSSYDARRVRDRANPFDAANCIVASSQTARDEPHAKRLLEAEPWDLVIVDEAHHAHAEDHAKQTQLFSLLRDMRDEGRMTSTLFFTGTPHRGKDFGFFSLVSLLRPDLFDPRGDVAEQLPHLREVMIRNNKANTTDLSGKRLFEPVTTEQHLFEYSNAEAAFYETMSAFIDDGLAYAEKDGGQTGRARKLIVTSLQKLATSSTAAIGAALKKRRTMLSLPPEERKRRRGAANSHQDGAETSAQQDLTVVADEIERLDALLDLHAAIAGDSKMAALGLLLDEIGDDESVLLFTEYMATQALVIETLEARFGAGCATFINGDGRLDGVLDAASGRRSPRTSDRDKAADDFNAGRIRFLVSTEAAGEGIDLQEHCATLVHADLPWNPMRLHQRVGRIYRYGQTRPVTVHLLRNPETLDGRIHELLQEKLRRIQQSLDASMEDSEDIAMLVLGMAGESLFDELHVDSSNGDDLPSWIDSKTRSLDADKAIETAKAIFGSVDRFDFGRDGDSTPKLDIDDLRDFVSRSLSVAGKRLMRGDGDGEFRFSSPDEWKEDRRLARKYYGLRFDRAGQTQSIFGVGHVAFDRLTRDSREDEAVVAIVDGLRSPLYIALASDAVDDVRTKRKLRTFGMIGDHVIGGVELLSKVSDLKGTGENVADFTIDTGSILRSFAECDGIRDAFAYTPNLKICALLLPSPTEN